MSNQAMVRKQTQEISTLEQAADKVDALSIRASELLAAPKTFKTQLAIATTIADLRNAFTQELMQGVMALQGTALGFKTDKVYPFEIVRDCAIEALARGFQLVGNEWNIISGQFYACKNGLRRKVLEWPGLTDFKDGYGVPKMESGSATVRCKAAWKLNGAEKTLEADIPVKLGGSMAGYDMALGKAERKLCARVLNRLAGITTPEGDADDALDVTPEPAMTAPPPPMDRRKKVDPAAQSRNERRAAGAQENPDPPEASATAPRNSTEGEFIGAATEQAPAVEPAEPSTFDGPILGLCVAMTDAKTITALHDSWREIAALALAEGSGVSQDDLNHGQAEYIRHFDAFLSSAKTAKDVEALGADLNAIGKAGKFTPEEKTWAIARYRARQAEIAGQ